MAFRCQVAAGHCTWVPSHEKRVGGSSGLKGLKVTEDGTPAFLPGSCSSLSPSSPCFLRPLSLVSSNPDTNVGFFSSSLSVHYIRCNSGSRHSSNGSVWGEEGGEQGNTEGVDEGKDEKTSRRGGGKTARGSHRERSLRRGVHESDGGRMGGGHRSDGAGMPGGRKEEGPAAGAGGPSPPVPPSVTTEDAVWHAEMFPSYMQSRRGTQGEGGAGTSAWNSHNGSRRVREGRGKGAGDGGKGEEEGTGEGRSGMRWEPLGSSSSSSSSKGRERVNGRGSWRAGEGTFSEGEGDCIWEAIRREAREQADREPLLSSFLYASVLAHPCFERSLGFVLANRLKNVTLLATQLMDVFDEVLGTQGVRGAIREDLQAVLDRDPSCDSYCSALLYYKGYHAIQSYRIAHALFMRGQTVLALALQSRMSEVFAVDIHPAATLGSGLLLDHGTGVVIGETARVGDQVSMLQGVTLGGTGKEGGDRHPKVGEGVLIGAGATVLGNIHIGEGSMVAAGSLVLKDVPPHSMVAGTPARVVGTVQEPSPSLTMKHDVTKDFCDQWEDAVLDQVKKERMYFGGTGI